MKRIFSLGLIGLVTVLAGCGRDNGKSLSINGGKNPVEVDKAKYLLAQEPRAAQGVIEVREKSKGGDAVVVVGRIGGSKNPFIKERAVFSIVDLSLIPCNEIEGDDCATPWDYCCAPNLAKATILVKFVDDRGQALAFDAERGLGLQPLQSVVVLGKLDRAKDGAVSVIAHGVFVRPEK